MANPYRFLALGMFGAFGAAIAGHFVQGGAPVEVPLAAQPELLPAAHANPVELAYHDTLRTGETLSELLARTELAEAEAKAFLAELSAHQDPRRLRPGAVVSYRKAYADGAVRGMAFHLDPDRTLTLQREGEEWKGQVEEVPVRTDTAVLSGVVESSLYAALLRGEEDEVPAAERERVADILAERIFAWQIDFARDLRKGDEFRILYERLVRPDGTARSGRVVAVQFSVNGRDYDAFHFTAPNGEEDYYDGQGESLRRAFLRAPLEYRRISSVFTSNRLHPITGQRRPHNGVDYAARTGTPVRAVADGVVTRAGKGGGYGNVVDIRHSRGYTTRYAHLNGFARGVRSGSRVRQGDIIGYVGMTGLATGPHLHYEFHTGGRPVDPNSVRHLTGDPVPARYRDAFRQEMSAQVAVMDRWTANVRLAERKPASTAPTISE